MNGIQHVSQAVQGPGRVAGALLVASLLILVIALVIMAASGALPAFSASLQGSLEQMAPYAVTFRRVNLLYAVGWIVELLGFGLLAHLLLRASDGRLAIEQVAVLALIAMLAAAILGILEASFHMSVTTWAAQEEADTTSLPDVYPALRQWVGYMQLIYVILGLLSLAGYGWALLGTGLLPPWVGVASLAWGGSWLLVFLVMGATIPGVLFIMPAVIGIALLVGAH